jgi:hypothetical protein
MFTLSPKSLLSPRFLALPAIALMVIVALAQNSSHNGKMETAGPTVVRAVNCSAPGNATNRACAVAHDDLRAVR